MAEGGDSVVNSLRPAGKPLKGWCRGDWVEALLDHSKDQDAIQDQIEETRLRDDC